MFLRFLRYYTGDGATGPAFRRSGAAWSWRRSTGRRSTAGGVSSGPPLRVTVTGPGLILPGLRSGAAFLPVAGAGPLLARLASWAGELGPVVRLRSFRASGPPLGVSSFRACLRSSGPRSACPGLAWCDLAELAALRGRGRSSGACVLRDQPGPLWAWSAPGQVSPVLRGRSGSLAGWPGPGSAAATGRRGPGGSGRDCRSRGRAAPGSDFPGRRRTLLPAVIFPTTYTPL